MKLHYLHNVVTLELDESRCTGCGLCLEVCPRAVFELRDNKARIVDRDACMECGACTRNCAWDALSVRSGVGCAAAVIRSTLTGEAEPSCGCSGESKGCCPSQR